VFPVGWKPDTTESNSAFGRKQLFGNQNGVLNRLHIQAEENHSNGQKASGLMMQFGYGVQILLTSAGFANQEKEDSGSRRQGGGGGEPR